MLSATCGHTADILRTFRVQMACGLTGNMSDMPRADGVQSDGGGKEVCHFGGQKGASDVVTL